VANKRRHQRVQGKGVASHVRSSDRSVACQVENISAGGVFVKTPTPVQLGLPVMVDLVKPGLKRSLRLSGRVVSVISAVDAPRLGRAAGMAVQFDPLPPDTEQRMHQLLRDLGLPEPTAAERLTARVHSLMDELAARDASIAERDQLIEKLQGEVKRLRALLRATAR